MAIVFDRLGQCLKDRGMTLYRLKTDKVVGNATIEKIKNNTGNIDTRTINSICAYLRVQPGEIMEYVEDGDAGSKERG